MEKNRPHKTAAYVHFLSFLKLVLTALSIFLVIIVFFNVVGRYVFNYSLAWAEEASRFLFIWVTFIGAVLVNENFEHMNLDIVVNFLPAKPSMIVRAISQIVMILVLGFIIKGGTIATLENLHWESPALEIPYGYVYSIVPFACTLMLLQTVIRLIRIVRPRQPGQETE